MRISSTVRSRVARWARAGGVVAVMLALALPGTAGAEPIPADLEITAFASFDVVFSDPGSGDSSQDAVLSSTQGGVTSQTDIDSVQKPPGFEIVGAKTSSITTVICGH